MPTVITDLKGFLSFVNRNTLKLQGDGFSFKCKSPEYIFTLGDLVCL